MNWFRIMIGEFTPVRLCVMKEIEKIMSIEMQYNVILSGKNYEYFIGGDKSMTCDNGEYFTDRHVVNYIYDKLQPKLNRHGSVRTMIDMFGGIGSFTSGYIKYLKKTYPKIIEWSSEINKIYHYDINEDVVKSAGLEFFCLTGTLPDMTNNVCCGNSFIDEFNSRKYDYVITNPPYKHDKIKPSIAHIKRIKVKAYIMKELETLKDAKRIKHLKRQLNVIECLDRQEEIDNEKDKISVQTSSNRIMKFAKFHNLVGNDENITTLILIMELLNEGGTCVGILNENIFFEDSYKGIRECLIKNFNVCEIISIPQNQFDSTKTSIIMFDNTEKKTTEIKFSELIVERYEEDVFEETKEGIIIVENKGEISGVSDKLISIATIDELTRNPIFSLKCDDLLKNDLFNTYEQNT